MQLQLQKSFPVWRRIRLGAFLTDVAIYSRYSRRIAYTVLRTFIKIFPIYLKTKREFYLPSIGKFYLRKTTRYESKKNMSYTFDKIMFKPSRLFKEYINNR